MNSKSFVACALVAVLALTLVPAIADDSEGAGTAYVNNQGQYTGFDSMNGGTLTFTVNNYSGGTFTMDVTVEENGNVVGSETVTVPAGESSYQVSVAMNGFTSVGTHSVTVYMTVISGNVSLDHDSFSATIVVDQNILNNWLTYVVIIIVVIVVVVFVYLKMRDTPKKTPDMTFEQLEEQRKAEMAAKSEAKKPSKDSGPSTERQRYLANKNKNKKE